MKSQNGWPAAKSLPIRPLVVAGESFAPGVLDDEDVYTVLRYVAENMHTRVEPVVRDDWHQADDWGFYFRANVNNLNELSNHSSGTAFDYNATRHPNGRRGTFTSEQEREIRKVLAEVDSVVRWGGDYQRTADEMHFEINASKAAVAKVAARIRAEGGDDMSWSEPLSNWYPGDKVGGNTMKAGKQLNQARGYAQEAYRNARQANARAERIEKAIKALAKGLGADVQAAVEEALKDAVISVEVNVNDGSDE